METVVKQAGQRYAKHFYKFEIKIMRSFRGNERVGRKALQKLNPGFKQIFHIKFTFVQSNGLI